jgi:hypothetical protein
MGPMGVKMIYFSPPSSNTPYSKWAQWLPKWYSCLPVIKHLLFHMGPNGCQSDRIFSLTSNTCYSKWDPMGFKWYSFLPIIKHLLCQVRPNGCSNAPIFSWAPHHPTFCYLKVGSNGCTRGLIFSHYWTQKKTIH